jgi:hypothetical protein
MSATSAIDSRYWAECNRSDPYVDIDEHLPTLYDYASRCNVVVECGVRWPISSYAFARGLKGNPKGKFYMIDIDNKTEPINEFLTLAKNEGVDAEFIHASDIACPPIETDLLFIDTWHVYGQLKRELAHWHASVRSYIIMHDTTVDGLLGETMRNGSNPEWQSRDSGIPVHEITKGLWPAIEEFLSDHPEWVLHARYKNCNGLTILKRIA